MLLQKKHLKAIKTGLIWSLLLCVAVALPAYAEDFNVSGSVSAAEMIKNIATQLPNLTKLITGVAYIIGMYFIISGVMRLKHMGEMRTMMSHEHSVKGPIIFIIIGAMLLYLPSTVQVGLTSFWLEPNPYGYLESEDQWADLISACFTIIQLVGVVAFIRGLIILTQMAHQSGGQHSVFGKGLTHIIGGILCINMYQFVQVIMVTLGLKVM